MMKRFFQFMVMISLVLTLAACEKVEFEEIEDSAIVIVAGKHANANWPTDMSKAKEMIEQSFGYRYDEKNKEYVGTIDIHVIVSDGEPESAGKKYTYTDVRIDNVRYNAEQLTESVLMALENAMAEQEEVDLLAAISEAQTVLDMSSAKNKKMLIIDTGLCTTGYFDMTEIDILLEDTDTVLSHIPEKVLPDLSGTDITFLNLGNVAGGQIDIRDDNSYKKRMVELWTTLLTEKCGGNLTEEIVFSIKEGKPLLSYEDGTGYPFVKCVTLLKTPPPDGGPDDPSKPEVTFKVEQLGFKGGSAEFRYPENALKLISSYVNDIIAFLNASEDNKIYIVGSIAKTAPDKNQTSDEVSYARAQKIAGILLNDFHIPADRMIVYDAGVTKFSWRNQDEFLDGKLSEPDKAIQAENRIVRIFGNNSENETEFLQKLEEYDFAKVDF